MGEFSVAQPIATQALFGPETAVPYTVTAVTLKKTTVMMGDIGTNLAPENLPSTYRNVFYIQYNDNHN